MALLVADVGHDRRKPAGAPPGRRHAQALPDAEPAGRGSEADRLAAGVRPGGDEGAVSEAIAERRSMGTRPLQQRMARGEELRGVRGWAGGRIHRDAEPRARHPQVGSREGVELARSDSLREATAADQLVQDALSSAPAPATLVQALLRSTTVSGSITASHRGAWSWTMPFTLLLASARIGMT